MWVPLLMLGSAIAVVLVGAWLIHRHQRSIDAYQEHEYREPPNFVGPDIHGGSGPPVIAGESPDLRLIGDGASLDV